MKRYLNEKGSFTWKSRSYSRLLSICLTPTLCIMLISSCASTGTTKPLTSKQKVGAKVTVKYLYCRDLLKKEDPRKMTNHTRRCAKAVSDLYRHKGYRVRVIGENNVKVERYK